MQRFKLKKVFLSTVLATSLIGSSLGIAYADDSSSSSSSSSSSESETQILEAIQEDIEQLSTNITTIVQTAASQIYGLMFKATPDLNQTIASNNSQRASIQPMEKEMTAQTAAKIGNIISTTTQNNRGTLQIQNLARHVPLPPSGSGDANIPMSESVGLTLNSLIGPLSYTKNSGAKASQFIKFLSYGGNPYQNLSAQILSSNSLSVKQYLAMLGTYATYQSIGLSNLDQLYAERTPVKGLGTLAGLSQANASPLEVDAYMAERRAMNSQWYSEMENAPPATIQREQLYIMAENRYELYKIRMTLQRLLATESAQEIMQTQTLVRPQLILLSKQAEKAAQQQQNAADGNDS